MGMYGNYLQLNNNSLRKITADYETEAFDSISNFIWDLETEAETKYYGIDKMWDALHFWLTSAPATTPPEDNALSRAILGFHDLKKAEGYVGYALAYTTVEELEEIIAALEEVDIDRLMTNFDMTRFHKADIYPDIWTSESEYEEILDDLVTSYHNLLNFYRNAKDREMNIIFTIT